MSFKRAEKKAKRLKMLLFGPKGAGKTVTALHFPNVACIDLEKGTDYYGEHFNFDVIQTSDIDKINEEIDSLLEDPKNYKTLVIDPITKWNKNLIEKHIEALRTKTRNPLYSLQPRDYQAIYKDTDKFIDKLLALDMNIICCCQQKKEYSDDADEFMVQTGWIPDGPKNIEHLFDVVIRLETNDNGEHIAHVLKDRTNKILERKFVFTYQQLVEWIGNEELEREPVAICGQNHLAREKGRTVEVKLGDEMILTAGITADQIIDIKSTASAENINAKVIKEKLMQDYNVEHIYDLATDEAALFIVELQNLNQ